jgi:membrane fusion protein (multidrug efflux system)
VAALVVAGVYTAHWWTTGRFIEATDDAYIGGDVTVIGPKVAGYIDEVLVTDNQKVKAGDVLIRLDSRDYRANLAKAEGAVAAEEALLANLDATEQLQQAVIGQARAGIDAAGAETARSRDDDARYKNWSAPTPFPWKARRGPTPPSRPPRPKAIAPRLSCWPLSGS